MFGIILPAAILGAFLNDPSPAIRPARLDHVLVGASDLARGTEFVAAKLGVTPAFGGKHPTGTQNALLSLGAATYLEVIAPQPGAPPSPSISELKALLHPKPFAWAVGADDLERLRARVETAGFHLSTSAPGSRTTPTGTTLRWTTFALDPEFEGAPFFIVWSPDSAHPSGTSPRGCSFASLTVSTPQHASLARLAKALDLSVHVKANATFAMSLSLKCPAGAVTLSNP